MVEIANDETLPLQLVETPARQEIVPPAGGSEASSPSNPSVIDDGSQEAYEKISAAMIATQIVGVHDSISLSSRL